MSLIVFNTLLLFAAVNLAAVILLGVLPSAPVAGALPSDTALLQQVYPDRDEDEIRALLQETWSREYQYEAFTQFREPAFSGRFVNTTAQGYRSTGRDLPWPPSPDVTSLFVFGGSTIFGYGVADDETVPAQLQELLDQRCHSAINVYNFARSNYFSSQESILFQRLLVEGFRPDLAVFIDGLNEFGHADGLPKFTDRLEYLMAESQSQRARRVAVNLPIARLLKRFVPLSSAQEESMGPETVRAVVDRWLANLEQVRAIGDQAGVGTLFVWQPVPGYGYNLDHHLFADAESALLRASGAGSAVVDRLRLDREGPLSRDFVWLGGLQQGRGEPLYVDRVHYSAAFSADVAAALARPVIARLCPAG